MSNGLPHHAALVRGYKLHWYEIESILGQGGFGITYLATDTNLDTKVAIKEFLPTDLAVRTHDSSVQPMSGEHRDAFAWGLSRFLEEARTLAKFQHPNIVRVYSGFEENNTAYMVMEYVEGQTLEEALKFRRIESEQQLLDILFPLLAGLAFLWPSLRPGVQQVAEESPVAEDSSESERKAQESPTLETGEETLTEKAAKLAERQRELEEEKAALEAEQAAAEGKRKAEQDALEKTEEETQLAEKSAKLAELQLALEEEQAKLAEIKQKRKEAEERQAEKDRRQAEEKRLAQEQAKLAEIQRKLEEEQARLAEIELKRKEAEQHDAEEAKRTAETEARKRELRVLLAQADEDIKAKRLTRPAENSAFQKYQRILENDPDNPEAKQGLERIVEEYIKLASGAQSDSDFDRAERLLASAEGVMPGAPAVALARQSLEEDKRRSGTGKSAPILNVKTADSLTIVSWGGSYSASQRKAYYEPFMAETRKTVLEDEWGGDIAMIRAMVQTGKYTAHLIDAVPDVALAGCAECIL